jgi:hypothetical protein
MNRRSFLGTLGVGAAAAGCPGTGVQVGTTIGSGPGGQGWQAGVTIGITIAKEAIPAARTIVDGTTSIPATTRASIDTTLQTALDAMTAAETAWNTFVQVSSSDNQCAVSRAIDGAVNATLQAFVAMRDAGVTVPAAFPGALQGIGLISDMLFPGCTTSSGSSSPTTAARRAHGATSGHVQHVLAGGSP